MMQPRTLAPVFAIALVCGASQDASAQAIGAYTFNTGPTSADRLMPSNVQPGATLSPLRLDSNGMLEDAGVNAVPSSANDGFGFGGNGGEQVMFWHRAENGVASSWGGFNSDPNAANTTVDTPGDIAPMSFTVTAGPNEVVSVDGVVIQAMNAVSPPYLVAVQPAGGVSKTTETTQDLPFRTADARIGGTFVVLPGQSQDFTIAWNSGNFNQAFAINQITVRGSVTDATGNTSFNLIADGFASNCRGAWSSRFIAAATADFTNGNAQLTPNPPQNAQPVAAYRSFNDVTLQNGGRLTFAADVSVTSGYNGNSPIKFGLGSAARAIGGEAGNIAVPLSGYPLSLPSNLGNLVDNPGTPQDDTLTIFPSLASVNTALDGDGSVNFFNLNPVNSLAAIDIALFDEFTESGDVTITPMTSRVDYHITRVGNTLEATVIVSGTPMGTQVIEGIDIVTGYSFNTVGFGHAFAAGETATFDETLVVYRPCIMDIDGDAVYTGADATAFVNNITDINLDTRVGFFDVAKLLDLAEDGCQ